MVFTFFYYLLSFHAMDRFMSDIAQKNMSLESFLKSMNVSDIHDIY